MHVLNVHSWSGYPCMAMYCVIHICPQNPVIAYANIHHSRILDKNLGTSFLNWRGEINIILVMALMVGNTGKNHHAYQTWILEDHIDKRPLTIAIQNYDFIICTPLPFCTILSKHNWYCVQSTIYQMCFCFWNPVTACNWKNQELKSSSKWHS